MPRRVRALVTSFGPVRNLPAALYKAMAACHQRRHMTN